MYTVLLNSHYYNQAYNFYQTPLSEIEFRKELKKYHESKPESEYSVNEFIENMMERNLLVIAPKVYDIHFDEVEENNDELEDLEFAEDNELSNDLVSDGTEEKTSTCEFCKKEKEDFSGVTFGKLICADCAQDLNKTVETFNK